MALSDSNTFSYNVELLHVHLRMILNGSVVTGRPETGDVITIVLSQQSRITLVSQLELSTFEGRRILVEWYMIEYIK